MNREESTRVRIEAAVDDYRRRLEEEPEFVTPTYTPATPLGWLCSKCHCITVDPNAHNSHHVRMFQDGIR